MGPRVRRLARFMVAAAFLAAAGAHAEPPPLEALAPRFDAGRVEAGTEVRHTYELRNRGGRTLQITVKPGCGCTTADYDKEIPPGGIGKVTAVLDTTRMHGRVEKIVDVRTDDPMQPVITLTILAESVRSLMVEPTDHPTLRGPLGRLTPVTLDVRVPDDAPFDITGVEDEATLRASFVAADEPAAAGVSPRRRWRVTLTPRADLPVGVHHATVTLRTTAPRAERFALPSRIVVAGPLVATPRELQVGAHRPTASLRITAVNGSAFRVLSAEPSDPDLTAAATPVAGESAWDLQVRYVGKPTRHGALNAVVTVVTDTPSQRQLVLRVSGNL